MTNTMNPMIINIIKLVFISLAVSSISMTITKAEIFAPIRNLLGRISKWLGKLFSCPYCMSHWIALPFIILYEPTITSLDGGWAIFDYVLCWFAVVTLASFWSGLIFRALSPME